MELPVTAELCLPARRLFVPFHVHQIVSRGKFVLHGNRRLHLDAVNFHSIQTDAVLGDLLFDALLILMR